MLMLLRSNMKQIIIATHNANKVKEYKELFAKYGYEVLSLKDVGYTKEIEETGTTFAENAIIKADTLCKFLNKLVISDDTGLMIEALDNKPGIYSARFMGEDTPQEIKNKKIIELMKDKANRKASFTCAIALAIPNKKTQVVEGVINGEIATSLRGDVGFGYDPIFVVPSLGKTYAELGLSGKNEVSHRFLATNKLIDLMKKEGLL